MTDQTQAAAPEAKKLSRRESLVKRYEAATAKYNSIMEVLSALANEINTIDALENITVGAAVILTVKAGEGNADVEGVVVGVRDEEDGSKTYKVQYGAGFDSDIAVVKGNKLKLPEFVAQDEAAPAE